MPSQEKFQITRRLNIGQAETDVIGELYPKYGTPTRIEIYPESSVDIQYLTENGIEELGGWQLAPQGMKTNIVCHRLKGLKLKASENTTVVFGVRF